jgi:hypothetical protein
MVARGGFFEAEATEAIERALPPWTNWSSAAVTRKVPTSPTPAPSRSLSLCMEGSSHSAVHWLSLLAHSGALAGAFGVSRHGSTTAPRAETPGRGLVAWRGARDSGAGPAAVG